MADFDGTITRTVYSDTAGTLTFTILLNPPDTRPAGVSEDEWSVRPGVLTLVATMPKGTKPTAPSGTSFKFGDERATEWDFVNGSWVKRA